jgi:hypothetical protein
MESDVVISYGYDINEWESLNPDEKVGRLNEVIFSDPLTLFGLPFATWGIGAAAGLLTLGVLFRKRILRGFRVKLATRKLKKRAEKFKEMTLDGLMEAIKPDLEAKEEIKRSMGVSLIKDLPMEKKAIVEKIERKISDVFYNYVRKVTSLKTSEIEKYIDNLKIKDNSKMALKFVWETLAAEVGVSLLAELMKAKAIETSSNVKSLNNYLSQQAQTIQKKGNQIVGGPTPTPAGTPTPSSGSPVQPPSTPSQPAKNTNKPTSPLKGGLI